MSEFIPEDPTAPYNPLNAGLPQEAFTRANRRAFGQAIVTDPEITFSQVVKDRLPCQHCNGTGCVRCRTTGKEPGEHGFSVEEVLSSLVQFAGEELAKQEQGKKTLKDLIPVEYFTPPPVAANLSHGRISIALNVPNWATRLKGGILVSWEKRSPLFDDNLAAARKLKAAGLGSYYPDAGGWVFDRSKVRQVIDAFAPSLVIDPQVKALLEAAPTTAPIQPVAAPVVQKSLHGKITLENGQYCVKIGNCGTFINKSQFGAYVDEARRIRHAVAGSKGHNVRRTVWELSREAAGRIVDSFPNKLFDYPPELVEDAKRFPAPKPQDPNAVPVDAKSDQLADQLLAAADDVLADL